MAGVKNYILYTYEGWLVCSGVLFTAASSIVARGDKSKIQELEILVNSKSDEIEYLTELKVHAEGRLSLTSIDVFEVFSLLLKAYSAEFNLGLEDRISLYKVSEDHFFILGRFSENQSYRKVGRKYYDRQQGILEKAFQRAYVQEDLPVSYGDAAQKRKRYADEQLRKFRIPVQITNKFNMKSRSYRALAIKAGNMEFPVAIICVESTARGTLGVVTRENLQLRANQVTVLISALEHHIPSMDNAMSRGL